MGRMYETLKLAHGLRLTGTETRPTAPADVGPCVVDWTLSDQGEAPFIEVGPGKSMEGSPDVLAVQKAHQPPVQPPHHAPLDKKNVEPAAPPQIAVPPPMTIAFQPWPGQRVSETGVSPDLIAYHQPDHAVSKQYSLLLEQMLQSQNDHPVWFFAGLEPQVGTTTVLLNLAVIAAAQRQRRVALVEANLPRPALAERLGMRVLAGYPEVLAGNEALEYMVVVGALANLHFLPANARGKPSACPPIRLEAVAWLVAWLRERYDLTMIDGPSLDDAARAAAWLPASHAVYAVAAEKKTTGQKELARSISRMGGRLRGLIHTHLEG